MSNSVLKPFINLGPGYTIKKYLDARDWSQEDLSQLMDISQKQLSHIINHRSRITIDTARLLAKAFQTSPDFWINLDTQYQLHIRQNKQKESQVERKTRIRSLMPVPEIIKKGWFMADKTAEGYESLYKQIWGKDADMSAYEQTAPYYARQKEHTAEHIKHYTRTWQKIAELKVKDIAVPAYSQEKLSNIVQKFISYTVQPKGVSQIIKDLHSAGVKFIVLSHLSKTYLDGACFYDQDNPVVVYTGRYNRVDNFWFTLAHEIAHIVLHLKPQECFLDDLQSKDNLDTKEAEADRYAEKVLHTNAILKLATPYTEYFSEKKLNEISKTLHIEQSVILGVLQHHGLVEYRKLNSYKKPILPLLPKEVIKG